MARKDDDTLKIFLAVALWIIGSATVGGFFHNLSTSTWMDIVIIFFVVAWGVAIIWVFQKIR